jgi:hypothetical protein
MTEGYIIPVCESTMKNAHSLASSIKLLDTDREVAFLVKDSESFPKRYHKYVDYLIDMPYGYDTVEPIGSVAYQSYYISPFDKTFLVYPNTLALGNIDHYWVEEFKDYKLYPSSDYRGTRLKKSSNCVMFCKSEKSSDFFYLLGEYSKNWRYMYRQFEFDFGFSLSATISEVNKVFNYDDVYSKFSIADIYESEKELDIYLYDNSGIELKIFNHVQFGLIEYMHFLNKDNQEKLDAIANKIQSR